MGWTGVLEGESGVINFYFEYRQFGPQLILYTPKLSTRLQIDPINLLYGMFSVLFIKIAQQIF